MLLRSRNLLCGKELRRTLIHRLLPGEIRPEIKMPELETALADSFYRGYIDSQKAATERVNHHDTLKVPDDFAFSAISGLSNEMVERLERAQPRNFAQVRNISGLTPAAISTVLVHLTAKKGAEPAPDNLEFRITGITD